MPVRHIKAKVSGRVQGVFYRQTACEFARRLGVSGWVKNRADGSVELDAEGDPAQIEELLSWCRQGPPSARVDGVEIELDELCEQNPQPPSFSIRY